MTKEPHISEFSAKKGSGLHIRVTTTRKGRRIAVDGGRIYYKDYGTKADTLRAARKIRDEILEDLDLTPTKMPTVEELFEKSFELIPLSIKTRTLYEILFRSIPYHDSPINTITLENIQSNIASYILSHSQRRTKRLHTLWKRIYKTAFLLQLPVTDYPSMVTLPKSKVLPRKQNREITYDQFISFITYIQEHPSFYSDTVTDISWIMYYTGIRIQEVLALSVDDIDLDRNIIHIRKSIGSTALKSAQIVPLKTDGSLRDIPIAPALVPVLQKALASTDHELLFHLEGNPLSITNIDNYIARMKRKSNLHFTLYGLRHLFATDLLREGINPKVIQTLMGHENADMTLYYAYTSEDERTEAIAKRTPS